MRTHDSDSRCVKIEISGLGENHIFEISARTIKNLGLPEQLYIPASMGRQNRANHPLATTSVSQELIIRPLILIGQDNADLIVSREVRYNDNVLESKTALGWTTHGKASGFKYATQNVMHMGEDQNTLEALVRANFAADSLGIRAIIRPNPSEERAKHIMNYTTRSLPSGHWETGLLWKSDDVILPDNRQSAINRLKTIERKMKTDTTFANAYKDRINQYVEKGYARLLNEEEVAQPFHRKWYLPHFAVVNKNKPGKLRIVFDAASRYKGIALNDNLLTGPDLLSSLLGNIFRFREGRIAIAADIQEMFLRIQIRKEDRKSQLFLWRDNPDENIKTYEMISMTFGAKCSPSSAQFVRNQLADKFCHAYPAASAAIKTKFYMDDYLDSIDSTREAKSMVRDVSMVLAKGGFKLTNWASNNKEVMRAIPDSMHAKSDIYIMGENSATESVLGIKWNPFSDNFIFRFENIQLIARPTKRELLSSVMRIFDPIGFVACLLIRSKILLQAVWRSNIGWDQEINPEHISAWNEWSQLIQNSNCSIPRRCLENKKMPVTLHIFCDASELAYCAVAYFVQKTSMGIQTSFIAAKCKVSPLRALSIPRLELQAALIAARLGATIQKESSQAIARTVYWTDSSTVLCWLSSDPRTYSSFVAHRLGEIDELTNVREWRWVPTKKNPADVGTRNLDPPDLNPTGLWYSGPSFLKEPETEWPTSSSIDVKLDDAQLERKAERINLTCTTSSLAEALPDIHRFSSWHRLIRTTAWVHRFISRCRRTIGANTDELTATELTFAEIQWVKYVQSESFCEEIEALNHGDPLSTHSRLQTLNPLLDSRGILCIGSRIRPSTLGLPYTEPIILDGNHHYTRLLIQHVHQKGYHCGTERTLHHLQGSFHIIRARTNIRMTVHKCRVCNIHRKKAIPPLMGQLPAGRLAHHERPFTHCGLDFFGPLYVTIGRRREKRYCALFTCLTTRAIHLELAASMETDSTIQAIRRMSARRGHPRKFYSDNGTNLRGADQEMIKAMRELQQDSQLHAELANHQIEWHYNPPATPHMGGAWERLVRSVKTALKAILKERSPREETLRTALAEAEFTVNSRPLTKVTVDPSDEEPLTPNHFLLGSSGTQIQLANYPKSMESKCLRRQWRIAQQLADMFWRRWLREYLPTLAQRQKWQTPATPLRKGDLVVIADAALPRNFWPRGIITEAIPAADGQVRSAMVKTATGELRRPAVKLIAISP